MADYEPNPSLITPRQVGLPAPQAVDYSGLVRTLEQFGSERAEFEGGIAKETMSRLGSLEQQLAPDELIQKPRGSLGIETAATQAYNKAAAGVYAHHEIADWMGRVTQFEETYKYDAEGYRQNVNLAAREVSERLLKVDPTGMVAGTVLGPMMESASQGYLRRVDEETKFKVAKLAAESDEAFAQTIRALEQGTLLYADSGRVQAGLRVVNDMLGTQAALGYKDPQRAQAEYRAYHDRELGVLDEAMFNAKLLGPMGDAMDAGNFEAAIAAHQQAQTFIRELAGNRRYYEADGELNPSGRNRVAEGFEYYDRERAPKLAADLSASLKAKLDMNLQDLIKEAQDIEAQAEKLQVSGSDVERYNKINDFLVLVGELGLDSEVKAPKDWGDRKFGVRKLFEVQDSVKRMALAELDAVVAPGGLSAFLKTPADRSLPSSMQSALRSAVDDRRKLLLDSALKGGWLKNAEEITGIPGATDIVRRAQGAVIAEGTKPSDPRFPDRVRAKQVEIRTINAKAQTAAVANTFNVDPTILDGVDGSVVAEDVQFINAALQQGNIDAAHERMVVIAETAKRTNPQSPDKALMAYNADGSVWGAVINVTEKLRANGAGGVSRAMLERYQRGTDLTGGRVLGKPGTALDAILPGLSTKVEELVAITANDDVRSRINAIATTEVERETLREFLVQYAIGAGRRGAAGKDEIIDLETARQAVGELVKSWPEPMRPGTQPLYLPKWADTSAIRVQVQNISTAQGLRGVSAGAVTDDMIPLSYWVEQNIPDRSGKQVRALVLYGPNNQPYPARSGGVVHVRKP